MRILVYSYFPVLSEVQSGGAQQMMSDLLRGLAEKGCAVRVVCPRYAGPHELMHGEGIEIIPDLDIPGRRPQRPAERYHNLRVLAKSVEGVDVIWTLDRAFPLRTDRPVVLTLDNFSYEAEMESLWSFCWDALIVPSQYLKSIAEQLVGPRHWEGDCKPFVSVVSYAVDADHFHHVDDLEIVRKYGLDPQQQYLLFPHRPDPCKGFDIALKALKQLADCGSRHRLAIPINRTYPEDQRYYRMLANRAAEMGIGSRVCFHEWIPLPDLPAYFSLGQWCLALGVVPEGFGLTPVQSVSCGTPVVSTRAGALAELLPADHGVQYVDFNSVEQVTQAIRAGVQTDQLARGRGYVERHYSVSQLVFGHLDCFGSVRKTAAHYKPLGRANRAVLSPWCHLLEDGSVWDDYRMCRVNLTRRERQLVALLLNQTGLAVEPGDIPKRLLAQGIATIV